MAIITKSTILEIDTEKLFSLVSDVSKAVELLPSIVDITDIKPLENGGTECQLQIKMGNKTKTFNMQTTEYVENERIVRVSKSEKITIIDTVTLEPENSHTRLTSHVEVRVAIPLVGWLLALFMVKKMAQELEEGYTGLQKQLNNP